jgi:uncharacterized protein (DUF1697 family)
MTDLVTLCRFLGFSNVITYLQSGNVVFDSQYKDSGQLSTIIMEEISRRFGFPVKVIVRTPEDFRRVIADNPLAKEGLKSYRLH